MIVIKYCLTADPEKFSDLQLVHDLEARNEEVKTLKARCKTHKNSLRDSEDRFAEVERKSKALQAQLDGELASYTEKVSHMETELLTRDRHIKTLSETAERNFNEQGSKAEATIQELKKRLRLYYSLVLNYCYHYYYCHCYNYYYCFYHY